MRVLLTGGGGMLASSIGTAWQSQARDDDLIPVARLDTDLRELSETRELFDRTAPDLVIHTAARVGGIAANIADPVGFLTDNLRLDSSVLTASLEHGVTRLLYFGSSCMYPRDYRQPLVESDVLAGPLEPTNEGYALAKITAARLCDYASRQYGHAYRVLIPSNLYGPHDDFSLDGGHLVAAAIAKAHTAKAAAAPSIDVWGDGTARREFTFVDDLASWVVANLEQLAEWPVLMNVGNAEDHSVLEYYQTALQTVGYDCALVTDPSKPAGMKQKLMDSSVARSFGWNPTTSLEAGMRHSYVHYLKTLD